MSPDGLTCVTVTETPLSSGSRMSPRRRMSESAWRNISPTRICRCVGPFSRGGVCCCRDMGRLLSQRALDGLDLVALDHVALLKVLVVREGHSAFLAGK